MSVYSEIVMILFGAAIGLISGVFPFRVVVRGSVYALNQDMQSKLVLLWLALWLIFGAVCLTTDIEFYAWHFFGSMLTVGVIAEIMYQRNWRKNQLHSDTEFIPSNYRKKETIKVSPRFSQMLISLFDPKETAFSNRNAVVCAALSLLAYRTEENIKLNGAQMGCTTSLMQAQNHTGFIMSTNNTIFITFRGTKVPEDWLTNTRIWYKTTAWGSVHAGFNAAVDALWPELIDTLRQAMNSQRSIWLTGHSLGGAMAMLTAARLTQENLAEVSGLYTFGQPMVGNGRFQQNFDRYLRHLSYRITTPDDEVPNQPGGFTHAGTLMYFDRNGKLHRNPGWWWRLRDQLNRDSRGLLGEHNMGWYFQLIADNLDYPQLPPELRSNTGSN